MLHVRTFTVLGFDMRSQQPMLAMFMPQNFQRCEFHLSAIFLFLSMHGHWSHVKTKNRMIPNRVWETAIQFTVLMYGYVCYRSKWFLGYSTFKLVYLFFSNLVNLFPPRSVWGRKKLRSQSTSHRSLLASYYTESILSKHSLTATSSKTMSPFNPFTPVSANWHL